ncbi:MAG TPA: chalcone isomerase family protein [Vicinamibacteria bacterium]|nr:chalcone isomerase family protein [Vicinamibacteria bacterium]
MRALLLSVIVALASVSGARAETVTEPRSGVSFEKKRGETTLTGVGLRTRTMLKVKVYAVGLYVADAVLAGPLQGERGRPKSPAFYQEMVSGDAPRAIHMKFVRDLSADQIRNAFREVLQKADKAKVDAFVGYFGELKSGQDCLLEWAPGGVLKTTFAGAAKPDIADKAFASAVFGIWLGEKPIQDDIKADLGKLF